MADDTSEAGPSSPPSPLILPLPPLDVRWVHAGAQHLDLLPTPITSLGQTYKAFSADESERIEERWLDMTEEERRKAVAEWGATEGEGAPAKVKPTAKDKEKEREMEKEKEKEKGTRRRSMSPNGRASNVHAHSLRAGEVQDRLDGKLPEKEEVFSGQEQVKEEGDTRYREVIRDLQKNYDLETIVGVPVSQVCRTKRIKAEVAVDDNRTPCSKSRYRLCPFIQSSGSTRDRGCPLSGVHGSLVTIQSHARGSWPKSSKRRIKRSSRGSRLIRTSLRRLSRLARRPRRN